MKTIEFNIIDKIIFKNWLLDDVRDNDFKSIIKAELIEFLEEKKETYNKIYSNLSQDKKNKWINFINKVWSLTDWTEEKRLIRLRMILKKIVYHVEY